MTNQLRLQMRADKNLNIRVRIAMEQRVVNRTYVLTVASRNTIRSQSLLLFEGPYRTDKKYQTTTSH